MTFFYASEADFNEMLGLSQLFKHSFSAKSNRTQQIFRTKLDFRVEGSILTEQMFWRPNFVSGDRYLSNLLGKCQISGLNFFVVKLGGLVFTSFESHQNTGLAPEGLSDTSNNCLFTFKETTVKYSFTMHVFSRYMFFL